jgi:hypothetical protein
MPSCFSVASIAEGSTPRIMISESWIALTLFSREMSTFPESLCLENRDDSFCSDDSLWTQAMYLEKCAFESSGDSNRLFRIGVPRLPQPRMQSVLPAMVRGRFAIRAAFV